MVLTTEFALNFHLERSGRGQAQRAPPVIRTLEEGVELKSDQGLLILRGRASFE